MWGSLESASFWHTVSNFVLIGGAGLTAIALVIVFLTNNAKEQYFKLEIAKLNESAKQAEQKAAEAELKLEQLRQKVAPRTINRGAFLKALEGKPKAPVEILYSRDAPDSINLSWQFIALLHEAGWTIVRFDPIPSENPEGEIKAPIPSAMYFGGAPAGVTIVAKVLPETVGEKPDIPFRVLWNAIVESMGRVNGGRDSSLPEDKLRIIIAPKEPWV